MPNPNPDPIGPPIDPPSPPPRVFIDPPSPIRHKKEKVTYTFKEKLSNGGVRTGVSEEEVDEE
jgi:hypothetical protein